MVDLTRIKQYFCYSQIVFQQLEGHTLTLLVRLFKKVRCVVPTRNRLARMIRCMNVDVDEAKRVCKDRSRWFAFCSFYLHSWEKGLSLCMYFSNKNIILFLILKFLQNLFFIHSQNILLVKSPTKERIYIKSPTTLSHR